MHESECIFGPRRAKCRCRALHADTYDAVNIGAGLSGQAPPKFVATAASTLWFNRLLNVVHAEAPTAMIVLARGPDDVIPAIDRELAGG